MSAARTQVRAVEPNGDGVMYLCRDDLVASFREQAGGRDDSLAFALRFFADYLESMVPDPPAPAVPVTQEDPHG